MGETVNEPVEASSSPQPVSIRTAPIVIHRVDLTSDGKGLCPNCGTGNSRGVPTCRHCGVPLSWETGYVSVGEGDKQLGEFGSRVKAFLVDRCIQIVTLLLLQFMQQILIGLLIGVLRGGGGTASQFLVYFVNFVFQLAMLGTVFAYGPFFWLWSGQTPGHRALGLRVQREDGANIDVMAALFRQIGWLLAAAAGDLGFLWASWDQKRQGWHDKMAHTIVVQVSSPRGIRHWLDRASP